jgi:hypothetical protein
MSNVKCKLNYEGVGQLLKSDEMMAVCKEYADKALSSLGSGYQVTTKVGKTRVNAEVAATTYEARKENAENNSILKALR